MAGLAQGSERTRALGPATPTCVAWGTRAFEYRLDAAAPAAMAAGVDAAFGAWQVVSDRCSDFTFTKGPAITPPVTGLGTGASHVVALRQAPCAAVVPSGDPCLTRNTCGSAYGCWAHSALTVSLTTITYGTDDGVISDADVELNGANFRFTTAEGPSCDGGLPDGGCVARDVQGVLTHELGHVLGFAHVGDATSTMNATLGEGETGKRRIDPGTEAGFCAAYPRGRPAQPCEPTPGGTPKPGCGVSGGAVLTVALVALARRRAATGRPAAW